MSSLLAERDERSRFCCATKRSVLDYFDRGLRRSRKAASSLKGDAIYGPMGLSVRFDVLVEDGVVRSVSFKASTCVTLVAYCELLAEWTTGKSLRDALQIDPSQLADGLAGVPAAKRDRAILATRAMQSALSAAAGATQEYARHEP